MKTLIRLIRELRRSAAGKTFPLKPAVHARRTSHSNPMGHRMSIGSEHCGQTNLWITSFVCVDFSLDSTYLNLHLGHTTGVSIIASVPYRADEASISTITTPPRAFVREYKRRMCKLIGVKP